MLDWIRIAVGPILLQSKDVNPLVFLADVYIAAPVHNNVLCLHHETTRFGPDPILRIRRYEIRNLPGTPGVSDVVHPQTGVEIGEVSNVVTVLQTGLMIWMVLVMWTEAPALNEEVFKTCLWRRDWLREK